MSGEFKFSLADLVRCSSKMRAIAAKATSMEEAACGIVEHLYDVFATTDEPTTRASALVRFYKTHPLGGLDEQRRRFIESRHSGLSLGTPCLTLFATRGDEPAWNDVAQSTGHLAIPL
ncbi:MAG TPA: hypothetical protein PKA58_33525, partial [Polyangium sp.]|nr:hypothetical protein [Polyangium sp.]